MEALIVVEVFVFAKDGLNDVLESLALGRSIWIMNRKSIPSDFIVTFAYVEGIERPLNVFFYLVLLSRLLHIAYNQRLISLDFTSIQKIQ
jgi:hypothetical protein